MRDHSWRVAAKVRQPYGRSYRSTRPYMVGIEHVLHRIKPRFRYSAIPLARQLHTLDAGFDLDFWVTSVSVQAAG